MAGEDVGEPSGADDSLEGWLDAKAEELGVNREELLARLRNGDAPEAVDGEAFAALQREFGERLSETREEFETQLAEVEADLADAEQEFDEKIQDVRERVVQVKRETDGKAPADHDHPDLRDQTESVADRADRLADELDALSETVEELDEQVQTGFENYEDVLEYLTDATDDLEARLATLAEVTVELRDQTRTLTARHAARAAADELAHLANRRGVESAKCGHCGETVHIGLLAEPKCPHCASTFNDVEPKQGLFGSAKLVVGDPPALEGERADWDLGDVTDGESLDAERRDIESALDDVLGEEDG
jgi:predicted  nucleic acid-binding Zn-ribbon protein